MNKFVEADKKSTKTQDIDPFAGLDDILSPSQDFPVSAEPDLPQDEPGDEPSSQDMNLRTASKSATQSKLRGLTPSDEMRSWMQRINPAAGGDEPELPDTPPTDLVVRTATDVPAVMSQAMQATGFQNPEWHHIENLPGFRDRNIRGMGRQVFGMLTSTPVEQIKTIANVNGQGPNTDAELRAVAGWLKNNAKDLGKVDVGHGMAIPGYEPDVREYSANGIRFHVVRDPMGQYIYAYPDKDAKTHGDNFGDQERRGQRRLGGGGMPRLTDSYKVFRPSLFERIQWDEELREELEELDESTLSKVIGDEKGGQKLIQWMHKKHKLSNEANLKPAPFNERLFWKQFKSDPDHMIVVACEHGVAGIKPHFDLETIKRKQQLYAKKGKEYKPSEDTSLPYHVVAFTDEGEMIDPKYFEKKSDGKEDDEKYSDPTVVKARMGLHSGRDRQNPDNVFNLISEKLGTIHTVFVTSGGGDQFGSGVERGKMAQRAALNAPGKKVSDKEAIDQVFNKVRPVLRSVAQQAMSHVQRSAQRYGQSGNFDAMAKMAKIGQKISQVLVNLDTSGKINLDNAYNSPTREFSDVIIKSLEKAAGSRVGTPQFNEWVNEAMSGSAVEFMKPLLDAIREVLMD